MKTGNCLRSAFCSWLTITIQGLEESGTMKHSDFAKLKTLLLKKSLIIVGYQAHILFNHPGRAM